MAPTEGGQVVDVTSLPPRRLVAERGLVLSAGFGGIPSRRRFALASCLPQAVPPSSPYLFPHLAVWPSCVTWQLFPWWSQVISTTLRCVGPPPGLVSFYTPPPPPPSISRPHMLMFASIVDNQPMPVGSPCTFKCHRTVLQASRLVTKKSVLLYRCFRLGVLMFLSPG